MSGLPKRYFTQGEYAMLEEYADYKSQYVAGEIFAMAGVEPWHDAIVQNLGGMFYLRFRNRPCRSFSAEVKIRAKDLRRPVRSLRHSKVRRQCQAAEFAQSTSHLRGPVSFHCHF